jgi:hypothetical protein
MMVGVRLTIALAALAAAAATPAPASAASDWRADGNAICTDFYDDLAIFTGEISDSAPTADLLIGLARLTERKDARLARVHPPAAHADTFARMVKIDRRTAKTLRQIAKTGTRGGSFERLINRYDRDNRTVERLARQLHLGACAGDGDVVTGPAVEL